MVSWLSAKPLLTLYWLLVAAVAAMNSNPPGSVRISHAWPVASGDAT
ncbi:hypothetical protein [Nocardia sp. NPDC005998]